MVVRNRWIRTRSITTSVIGNSSAFSSWKKNKPETISRRGTSRNGTVLHFYFSIENKVKRRTRKKNNYDHDPLITIPNGWLTIHLFDTLRYVKLESSNSQLFKTWREWPTTFVNRKLIATTTVFSFHDKNTTSWKRESSIDKNQWKKSCDFFQWKIAFFSLLHPGRSLHETASDLNLLTFRSDIVRGPLAFIDIKLYRLRRLYWLWDVLEDGSARELCASDSLCRCVAEQLAWESAGAICILLTVW